jgi:hypothetical protein
MSLVVNQDENERSHGHCLDCGYNTDADGSREMAEQDRQDAANEAESSVELERDTPFGEELDAGQEPYDGGGWPGDGSGTDDLADYNANEADDYRNEGCE